MKLLFIKLKLIGDALILTGVIRAVKRAIPGAEIHVVVRKGTEGILAGCPEIDVIHTTGDKKGGRATRLKSELTLVRRLRAKAFDHVFELGDGDRGRTLALLSGARRRHANTTRITSAFWRRIFAGSPAVVHDGRHAVTWDAGVVGESLRLSFGVPAPVFVPERASYGWIDSLGLSVAPVFIHPVASREGKMWRPDGWVALVRHFRESGIPVILSCGPAASERELCDTIARNAGGEGVFKTEGRLDWVSVAGALYRSRFYVGLDTAAMHLAAACGRPVVALFAMPPESYPTFWGPLGVPSVVLTPPPGEITPKNIAVADVLAAVATFSGESESLSRA